MTERIEAADGVRVVAGGRRLVSFAGCDYLGLARRAIDEAGGGVVLTGRSEGFIVGRPDLAETLRRLAAYADAGADCLYAPGASSPEQIAAIVAAVAPKPVNVLVSGPGPTVAGLAARASAASS